jgi:hypothetical protein
MHRLIAIATCFAPASASEKTATVPTPSLRAVSITRQAISPRLAIRILVNIAPPARTAAQHQPRRCPPP